MKRKYDQYKDDELRTIDARGPDAIKKSVPKKKSEEDILDIIDDNFGSVQNVLQLCGIPGCFLILGPTGSGKTSCIGAIIREAQQWSITRTIDIPPIIPSAFVIISDTDELSEDLKWCKDKAIHMKVNNTSISTLIEQRKKEIEIGASKTDPGADGKKMTPKEWGEAHPLFVIVDDFYGKIEASRPNNPVNQLTTKSRHYGIYLFLLAQGYNQCSPVIKDNAMAIITFKLNARNHADILSKKTGKPDDDTIRKLAQHNGIDYQPVIYYRTWELSKPKYGSITPIPLISSRFIPVKVDPDNPSNKDYIDDLDYSAISEEEEDAVPLFEEDEDDAYITDRWN